MKTYKILHLIGGGEIGGAEQHVLTLLNGLDNTRFSPYLACLTSGTFSELAKKNNISTRTFPMRHPLDLSPLPGLLRWARHMDIDIFHTHGSRANLLGRLGAKWLGIPCITTVHSSLAHDYLSPWAARFAIALDRLTLPLTSQIITVSEHLAEEIAQRGGKSIETIYNGQVPLTFNDPSILRSHFRKQWNIPEEAFVVGNIARLHPTKGQIDLVRAAAQLRLTFPNLHLLFIGDGPLRQELKTELTLHALPHTLTGYLPRAYEALPAMDLFALPSISEGMGLVLLEAMQAGIPIVASAVGGIPEVVRSGKDGLLVPPRSISKLVEACAKVMLNPALAKDLIRSGKSHWQQFSIEKMLMETEQVYERVLR